MKLYFLTLIPYGYEHYARDSYPRCVGFSERPFEPSALTEHDTESGFYKLAVQEVYEQGLWPKGEVLEWWKFADGSWSRIDPPEWTYRVTNWAIV